MPYNLEKGPYLSMFEHLFNSSPDQLKECLAYLRDKRNLVTGLLDEMEVPIPAGPYPTTKELADHINKDWFGLRPNAAAAHRFDNHQEPFDPVAHPSTGFWNYWYGDSQAVVRTALVRAIETALGLARDEEIPDGPPARHWRLNLFTICGIRWFEAWINWRQLGDAAHDGMVTVFLLTPSHGKLSEPSLLRHLAPDRPGSAPYEEDPEQAEGDQGLWVVGLYREEHTDVPPSVSDEDGWSGLGEIHCPRLGATYVGVGDVVVVSTPESEGGVLPDGRAYHEVL